MADDATTTAESTTSPAAESETGSPTRETTTTETDHTDLAAEVEKWKALSRKNEARAAENAKKAQDYDAFQESQKSELQKAQEAATNWENKFKQSQITALQAETAAKNGLPIELLTATTQDALDAQVAALQAFKTPIVPKASGVDTSGSDPKPTYTRAQLSDPKFYKDHHDDILLASREGRITA
ncbi:MAG: hypothetical protein LKJ05_02780 [Bifidobacteriaceae bacterium]|jgi:hypothetical protein|nr:hypothetical protein [Bifidobacteriaceae bacterium]